ncbi:AB hydrolase superfamily protein [Abortiporus biennis]
MSVVPLDEFSDIAYNNDPLHKFDIYIHPQNNSQPPPLVVFVHGGAWRSEDKADYAFLARQLAARTSLPVAVPNYRLTKPTSPIQHPEHSKDLLTFLHFILTWHYPSDVEPGSRAFDPNRLYLIGHSCSAHMLTSILLQPPIDDDILKPSQKLLHSTKAVILSEGIYDIDLLLHSFPSYKDWFIANTFGDRTSYKSFSTNKYDLRLGGEHIHWLVLHSSGDTLVDVLQSKVIYDHLRGSFGGSGKVGFDDSLTKDHNDIFKDEHYLELVSAFLSRLS